MIPTLQINLIVAGRKCLVIGGHSEAEDKVARLLDALAVVTVISPELTPNLRQWAAERRFKHFARDYQPDDEEGFFLVWLAVQDTLYGESLFTACGAKGVLMAAWDQPKISNFNFPALVRSGPVRIAVSTGGASPGLAAQLRKNLQRLFDERFGRYAQWAGDRRDSIRGLPEHVRFEAYRSLTDGLEVRGSIEYPEAWKKTESPS